MKLLADMKKPVPAAGTTTVNMNDPGDRIETGIGLISMFLADGMIRGISPRGKIFGHRTATELTHRFLAGLESVKIRGTR